MPAAFVHAHWWRARCAGVLELAGGVGPVVGLTLEVLAGALFYALGAFLFAREATRDLIDRILDAVRPARRRATSAGQTPP